MTYSAGFMRCPKCFGTREFFTETMPAPGRYPEAECCACGYVYPEGSVPDHVREKAIEALRADVIRHSAIDSVHRVTRK